MADSDSKVPPQGKFQRFRKLAGLSASVGTNLLSRGVKRLAGTDAPVLTLATAERIVSTLGELKGAAMKLGQMASMETDLLPDEARAILARLQNEAPPMPFATVREVVEEELGGSLEALFTGFEPEPMAAASLGQVHRARLSDGRQVAVKVQYPGIAEALVSDLKNFGAVVKAVSASRIVDWRAYFDELREQMTLELDYRREAELAEAFARAAAPFPELRVPRTIPSRTAGKVLTLELLEGPTLKQFLASQPTPEDRWRVSRQLILAIYGPFLGQGLIHADPHPGNFLVLPDGTLGVLDFGAVKQFSETFRRQHVKLFRAGVDQVDFDVLDHSRALGFTFELPEAELEPLLHAFIHAGGRMLKTAEYDFSTCEVMRDLRRLLATNAGKFFKIHPPKESVLFLRAAGGLLNNLKALGASGPVRQVYREAVEAAEALAPG